MKHIRIYAENIEQEALEQFNKAMQLECNIAGALMPDAHTGYTLPIGAVVRSRGIIFPAYVGYDIGCGMCAVKLNIKNENLNLELIKERILNKIPLGTTRHKSAQIYNVLECSTLAKEIFTKDGAFQLGTLGSGNHFIELGVDSSNNVWIVVHSGSRGFGKQIAEFYMQQAALNAFDATKAEEEFTEKNKDFKEHNRERFEIEKQKYIEKSKEKFVKTSQEGHFGFDINSELGKQYLKDLNCALEFALENRKRMILAIIDSINEVCFNGEKKVEMLEFINKNHNHAIVEKEGTILHRKGATNANLDEFGVIPGNMRDGSFIVKGLGNFESLFSSSHGAGRVLTRMKAKKVLDFQEFQGQMQGITTNHTIEMLDEAPNAYKNIFEVMEAQKDLVKVVEHIKPILNLKG